MGLRGLKPSRDQGLESKVWGSRRRDLLNPKKYVKIIALDPS